MTDNSLAALHTLPPARALPLVESHSAQASVLTAEERDALARSFPIALDGLSNEVQIALGKLAIRLLPHGPAVPNDLEAVSAEARVTWHRYLLGREDSDLASIDDGSLHSALSSWPIERVSSPRDVLARCARSEDRRLARYTIVLLRDAITKAALTPEDGLACATLLAEHSSVDVREASVCVLLEPFARAASLARVTKHVGKLTTDTSTRVRMRAIDAASVIRDRETLCRVLGAEDPASVAAAMHGLARCANREDLTECLAIATTDTLRFAEPLRSLVLGAHLHGAFVQPDQLSSLLECFDANEAFTAEELARVTYTCRHELVQELSLLAASDPRWMRRAAILAHSDGRNAASVLTRMLASATSPEHALPFLRAAAHCPTFDDAHAIAPWLTRLPHESLDALAAIDDEVGAGLVLDALREPLAFDSARPKAITLVWSLIADRTRVIETLGVDVLTAFELGTLRLGSSAQAELFLTRLASAPIVQQLEAIAEVCDIDLFERFESLFRDGMRAVIGNANGRPRGWASHEGYPPRDATIDRLLRVATRFGKHLTQIGRQLPSMRNHDDLALVLVVRFVAELSKDNTGNVLDESIIVALLETLRPLRLRAADLRTLRSLVRHRNTDVRRAFMEVSLASRDASSGLAFSLSRLAADEEPKALRQALRSISAFNADWAERFAIDRLDHPNMNIKRTAAEALAAIGTPSSIPSIVGWLGRHDNAGFRDDLLRALDCAAGRASTAVLLAALDDAKGRTRELLCAALDRRLDVATVVRIARDAPSRHARSARHAVSSRPFRKHGARDAAESASSSSSNASTNPARAPTRRASSSLGMTSVQGRSCSQGSSRVRFKSRHRAPSPNHSRLGPQTTSTRPAQLRSCVTSRRTACARSRAIGSQDGEAARRGQRQPCEQ